MEGPLRMGVILASVRDGRRGEPFARWIHALAAEREGLFVELLDLREWALPAYARKDTPNVAEKAYAPDSLEGRWRAKIDSQDAFVVVTPEYNHSFPGQLKNAFVSYGGFASGARAAEHLRLVAIELRMAPIRDEVNVRLVGYAADERGFPADPLYAKKARAMLDDLVWWARVLREGREAHRR